MFALCRHVRRFSRLRQVPTRPDTFCRSIGAAESPAQPRRTDEERYGSVDRSVQLRGSETSDTARSVAMPISRCGIYRYAGITSFSSYISGETAFCREHFPQ